MENLLDEVFVDAVREARVEELIQREFAISIRVEGRQELADMLLEIRGNSAVMEPRDLSEFFECNQRHFFFSLRSYPSRPIEIVSLSLSSETDTRSLGVPVLVSFQSKTNRYFSLSVSSNPVDLSHSSLFISFFLSEILIKCSRLCQYRV